MKISFRCTCGAPYEVDESLAGKRVRCKTCAKEFRVPVPAAAEPDLYDLDHGPAPSAPLPPRRESPAPPRERPAAKGRVGRKTNALWSADAWGEVARRRAIGLVVFALVFGAWTFLRRPRTRSSDWPPTLAEARRGFHSMPVMRPMRPEPAEIPPPDAFQLIRYPSPVGFLAAYLTPDPGDGRKHPAIVWITGGDCNSIGDVWSPAPARNDQTARAFREAGIVMMFPSLRGGNDNPAPKESFLGEVDDVIAAADFLAQQPHVDPTRIYLGGHSTGGTLVLLVAETTDRFRAVFSFGPVDDVSGYSDDLIPFNTSSRKDVEIRSPGYWLDSVRSPTFVLEGAQQGNVGPLRVLKAASKNPQLRFHVVSGADHFSILAPITRLLAAKVLADKGPTCSIQLDQSELDGPFGR